MKKDALKFICEGNLFHAIECTPDTSFTPIWSRGMVVKDDLLKDALLPSGITVRDPYLAVLDQDLFDQPQGRDGCRCPQVKYEFQCGSGASGVETGAFVSKKEKDCSQQ